MQNNEPTPGTPEQQPQQVGSPVPEVPALTNNQPEQPKQNKDKKYSGWGELFSTISIFATALGVAILIIMFVFRSYQVDGPSMESTLQNSDKLIIWKVPRTWARITGHDYIPKRGDIIVFSQSGLSEFGQTDTKQLIKRVIGVPGDHVSVENGKYVITNAAHPNGFNPDTTLGYGKNIPTTSGYANVTLHAGEIFVSGDNRPDSLDSRSFGPVQANKVIGKLVLRVFPVSQAEAF